MQRVKLRVINRQSQGIEEPEELQLVTEAQYAYKNGMHYFIYDESVLSGMDVTKTTLRVGEDSVSIKRFGNHESLLRFQVGQRFTTQYPTPYGVLKLELTTQGLDIQIEEGPKGKIEIKYTMMLQSMVETKNEILIEIF